jgi:hypothetical protein
MPRETKIKQGYENRGVISREVEREEKRETRRG